MKPLFLLLLSISLFADFKGTMLNLYQNSKYEESCNIGFNNFSSIKKDEPTLSLYAFSCLNSDFIDRLTLPITMLKYSRDARANAAYFSIILMQKKLLYHSLIDSYDLSKLNLPTTNYVLSKVFDFYSELGKHKKRSVYLFKDKQDKKRNYKLYVDKSSRVSKIVIEEFYDTISKKRHIYW